MAMYKIKTTNIKDFTGVDAGGVAFANGEAKITDDRMAAWFREHEGYSVERMDAEHPETPEVDQKSKKAKGAAAEA